MRVKHPLVPRINLSYIHRHAVPVPFIGVTDPAVVGIGVIVRIGGGGPSPLSLSRHGNVLLLDSVIVVGHLI